MEKPPFLNEVEFIELCGIRDELERIEQEVEDVNFVEHSEDCNCECPINEVKPINAREMVSRITSLIEMRLARVGSK